MNFDEQKDRQTTFFHRIPTNSLARMFRELWHIPFFYCKVECSRSFAVEFPYLGTMKIAQNHSTIYLH